MDKLCDAGLSGRLGNLLREGHKDILEAVVAVHKEEEYLHMNNKFKAITLHINQTLLDFCQHIPRFPLSANEVDDNIRVVQRPFDGVFVPRIPIL